MNKTQQIDFFRKKMNLHKEMLNAIEQLIKLSGRDTIDFRPLEQKDEIDYAYVHFEPDGYQSAFGIHADAVRLDGCLKVHEAGTDFNDQWTWYIIGEHSNIIPCSIDTVYDATYFTLLNDGIITR